MWMSKLTSPKKIYSFPSEDHTYLLKIHITPTYLYLELNKYNYVDPYYVYDM